MYGIAKMVGHGDRIFQHSAESLTHAHLSFVTLKVFERARFTVWRGALKIRVSMVRFRPRTSKGLFEFSKRKLHIH
jgi:hypothetical protein